MRIVLVEENFYLIQDFFWRYQDLFQKVLFHFLLKLQLQKFLQEIYQEYFKFEVHILYQQYQNFDSPLIKEAAQVKFLKVHNYFVHQLVSFLH